ncbi:hypothetical protein CLROS_045860 (plasmid) [Clostridium felsineum]|uniref:Uncharacterized protein n=1 Tax=Clostridium felsineum TaxID=36839 RepID=A0A1S8LZT4_9CLOT|nr:hypothetical protein CLROS_045860 [Clostridium felsineum]URZ13856.1 hypothetical protein CROST_046340 [Clostridium felsineum]
MDGNKKLGTGSLSVLLSLFGIVCSFTYFNKKNIGDLILNSINIYKMCNIISIFLFIFSIFIGIKYRQYWGAQTGKNISIFFIVFIFILSIINIVRVYL